MRWLFDFAASGGTCFALPSKAGAPGGDHAMGQDGPPLFFILAITAGGVVMMVVRTISGEEQPLPPLPDDGAVVVAYRPLAVAPGHGRRCGEGDEVSPRPQKTATPPMVAACLAIDPPRRAVINVRFDVDPRGHTANPAFPPDMPRCLAEPIRGALAEWRYCPRIEHGEAVWRYGEEETFFFERVGDGNRPRAE